MVTLHSWRLCWIITPTSAAMDLSKPFLHGSIFYDFKSGLKVTESAHCINITFGPNSVSERTVRELFTSSRANDYNLQDQPLSGHPSHLRQLVWSTSIQQILQLYKQICFWGHWFSNLFILKTAGTLRTTWWYHQYLIGNFLYEKTYSSSPLWVQNIFKWVLATRHTHYFGRQI
jgi:hypothetical protein